MSHRIHLWAEVSFPGAARQRWEGLSLGRGADLDWKDASLFAESSESITVEAALAALREEARREESVIDYLSLELGEAQLSLRALVGEDAFIHWGGNIAVMVRLAGTVGARGELAAMTDEGDSERIVLDDVGGRVESFFAGDMSELATDYDYPALFDEILAGSDRQRSTPAEAEQQAVGARRKQARKRR